MRDIFELPPEDGPTAAARRSLQAPVRRRTYGAVEVDQASGGHRVTADGKPLRTPAGRMLVAPTAALARAIADEWQAQREVIDPETMPLTRLANAIIDGVADRRAATAAEIERYLASDLLFYRAAAPERLREPPRPRPLRQDSRGPSGAFPPDRPCKAFG